MSPVRQAILGAVAALALSLTSAAPATAYTAVALSGTLAYGYCSNQQSMAAAADCAMRQCQQAASDPHSCAIGLESEPAGHYSLAIGGGGWGAASGQSAAEADSAALGYCQLAGCEVVARWTEGIVRGQ